VASLVERSDEISNQMPIYVAERALELAKGTKNSPKVLIMGVAYKPGVGDVRETPASALRAALVARGAEVAWVDPLVPLWEGTKPVTEAWNCDVAVVATNQPGLDVKALLSRGIPVLDCTNNYGEQTGVELL
jgi:UDP-N-acetyl-D-glucosamine dehydrogenase